MESLLEQSPVLGFGNLILSKTLSIEIENLHDFHENTRILNK